MITDRRCCVRAYFGAALLVVCFVPGCKTDSESASATVKSGNELLQHGKVDASIAVYTKAIRLDPKNPEAYLCRACAYQEKCNFDKAIADETAAIRLDPTSATGYGDRGFTYVKTKDFDRAIADFTEAIRLEPKDAGAKVERAASYHGRRWPTLVKVSLTRQLPTVRRPSGSIKRSSRTIRTLLQCTISIGASPTTRWETSRRPKKILHEPS